MTYTRSWPTSWSKLTIISLLRQLRTCFYSPNLCFWAWGIIWDYFYNPQITLDTTTCMTRSWTTSWSKLNTTWLPRQIETYFRCPNLCFLTIGYSTVRLLVRFGRTNGTVWYSLAKIWFCHSLMTIADRVQTYVFGCEELPNNPKVVFSSFLAFAQMVP